MSNVSFGNLTNSQPLPSEAQKRLQSEENFGAIDTQKLKQDTVDLTKKTVKENFVFRTLRNVFGVEDPKKFLISLGLTAVSIAGFSALGNKFNKQIINFSSKVDDFIKNASVFKKFSEYTSKAKKGIGKFFDKFEFTKDIKDTLQTKRLNCINPMARTSITGPKGQFSYNVMDTVQAVHLKMQGDDYRELRKAFGHGRVHFPKAKAHALEFITNLANGELITQDILKSNKGIKGLNESKIQDFVKRLVNLEDLAGTLGKQETEKRIASLLEDFKKMGMDDKKAAQFFENIKKLSEQERGTRFLKDKLGDVEATALIQKIKNNNHALRASIEKLVGKDCPDLEYFYKNFTCVTSDADRASFAQKLTKAIAKGQGLNEADPEYSKKLAKVLQDLTDGKLGDNFTKVTMNREGIFQGWSLANFVDSIGSKIFKSKWKPFGKGNLGDALTKFNMADGKLAQTAAGKLTQKLPLYIAESVSNNVADLSTVNMIITVPMLLDLFNSVQEAPKEQKVATLADNFIGGLGQFAISMPLASSIVYGIASTKNIKGNNPVKWIGKVVGMGLDNIKDGVRIPEKSYFKRFAGGALRLWAILLFLSPKISKIFEKGVNKIFGKPYNKEEAQKAKELEEQSKQVIPELGITQGEFLQKLQNNPQAIAKMQNDPALLKAAQANPKIILDLLDGKEVNTSEIKPKFDGNKLISPANANLLKNKSGMAQALDSTSASTTTTKIQNNIINNVQAQAPAKAAENVNVDTATYIPSSAFTATSSISTEQQSKINAAMSKADKLLVEAQKYI